MRLAVIDLFCGIGGLGLGAVRAGFELALSVDVDRTLLDMHKKNFPSCGHLHADVRELSGAELLVAAQLGHTELTGLIGGSPCQGFSRIGKRKSSDSRNALFSHFFRLVSETEPTFFLAENVLGILDTPNQKLVEDSLDWVRQKYRVLPPLVLDAADFGAATTRERVFFVGYLPNRFCNLTAKHFESQKWPRKTTVETALSGLPRKLRATWISDEFGWRTLRTKRRGRFWNQIYGNRPVNVGDPITIERFATKRLVSGCVGTRHSRGVEARFRQIPEGGIDAVSRMPRLKRTGLCPTIRAGTGPENGSFQALRPIHFLESRVITPREAARLQGFPDWFHLGVTKWHAFRGIGNSVSPFVASGLFQVLAGKLKRPDCRL